jgi:hypothetical protein
MAQRNPALGVSAFLESLCSPEKLARDSKDHGMSPGQYKEKLWKDIVDGYNTYTARAGGTTDHKPANGPQTCKITPIESPLRS